MSREYIIPACSGMKIDVKQGQSITVIDIEGGQVVDFFAEVNGNVNEFLSTGVTIDCNESLKLNVGDIIYTNLYRPMIKVLTDDVGEHDLLHPCCRPGMYDFFYHNGEEHPNCFDNINRVLDEQRAVIVPVNLFMHTKISTNGSISVEEPVSKAGDKIVLKQLEAEETTKSGIVLPGQAQEKPQQAEVIAVGPGGMVDGKEVKMEVAAGDQVIYSKYAGTEVKLDGEEYIIVKQNDILAVVK